jgi:predicted thioredoxin/glutaredoxin
MAKLIISTQVLENYGTEDNPFWKAKGGDDYVVKNFRDFNRVNEVVMALRSEIEIDNPFCQEYIRSWEVVADDYLTEFERSQLQFEGKVVYAPRELAW